jgi:NADH dehydrogenase
MKLAGFFAEFQPALLGPPPITRDQADLLTRDNIVRAGARTLADLGIEPTAAEAILPTYLDRFRPAGRYNQTAPV